LLKQHAVRLGYKVEAMSSVTVEGERVSSTRVRKALEGGDLAFAARLLGRPYSIAGRVVRGEGLGRKLGFPTANVQMKHNRAPLGGIFAVEVSGAGDSPIRGVASLGVRPTVQQQGEAVLEVYLLDFAGDLYGRHVHVDFLRKFRDEEKFADLAALTQQITADVANAQAYFAQRDVSPMHASGEAAVQARR
jgi:riboflavin kinase/FMN adenylyltransferase